MNFWWVNHKQTFRHEFRGGYLWSPKAKSNGTLNPYYDSMKLVRPGDVIFSFANAHVQGIGIARSHCYTCPKPDEFGHVGTSWEKIGWRVDAAFFPVGNKLRPKSSPLLEKIGPFVGRTGFPLLANGNGRQDIYLTNVSEEFAHILFSAIGDEVDVLLAASVSERAATIETALPGVLEWERVEEVKIQNSLLPETERLALIRARVGQGKFKENVSDFEDRCRITGVTNPVHLVASHIKPWRESANDERLCAANGLLLTPTIDHLFDRGFISFGDSGETVISPVADRESLLKFGIDADAPPHVGKFTTDQKHFLEYHRKWILLKTGS